LVRQASRQTRAHGKECDKWCENCLVDNDRDNSLRPWDLAAGRFLGCIGAIIVPFGVIALAFAIVRYAAGDTTEALSLGVIGLWTPIAGVILMRLVKRAVRTNDRRMGPRTWREEMFASLFVAAMFAAYAVPQFWDWAHHDSGSSAFLSLLFCGYVGLSLIGAVRAGRKIRSDLPYRRPFRRMKKT
jgi:O-antigen/teichoic acid export membrane protein